ncbi:L,D-transpeptidase family protein [bacterium]|jgi:lipoprotein-anchoring transpeptidase ErfK/SrfK/Tfp pilus assembly protein PilF|nr:L,D-transpeptidase family protein [bacterium]
MKAKHFLMLILIGLLIAGVVIAHKAVSMKMANTSFEAGREMYSAGDYIAASEKFQRAYSSQKETNLGRDSLIYYARCLTKLNKPEAFDAWEKVGQLGNIEDRKAEVLYNLGLFAFESGDLNAAENYFSEVLRKYSSDVFAGSSSYFMGLIELKQGYPAAAKERFVDVVRNYPNSDFAESAQEKFGDANILILFSEKENPFAENYIVENGDSLSRIANRYNTTIDLIKNINKLDTGLIRAGQSLKVPKVTFSISIDKSQNKLMLLADSKMFKIYTVGTGVENSTPTGKFNIINKIENPPWKGIPPEDPRNILGSRWMGFNEPYKSYGIHGTTEPETIGYQSSAGCVRMYNHDVEEIFKIIPVGTEVTIVD